MQPSYQSNPNNKTPIYKTYNTIHANINMLHNSITYSKTDINKHH